MNIPFIKKWIEALRSGKYKQVSMVLRASKDCFCAWGVACDVYNPNYWETWDKCYLYLGNTHCVARVVNKYSRLSVEEAIRIEDMNDRENRSFEDIASYLEGLINARNT